MSTLLEIANAEEPVPFGTEDPAPNAIDDLVANETDIASPTLLDLVQRFRKFRKETAKNYIRMAATLAEAKRKLSELELNDFCAAVCLKYGGSTYKKMLKIGEKATRFEPFLDQLPDAWTTLYKLASLENEEFKRVTTDVRFGQGMTAVDLEKILAGEPNGLSSESTEQAERLSNDCRIHLKGFEAAQKIEVCRKLLSLAAEYGFKCSFSSSLEKELLPKPQKPSFATSPCHCRTSIVFSA